MGNEGSPDRIMTAVYNGVRFGGRRDTAREMVSLVDELDRVLKRS